MTRGDKTPSLGPEKPKKGHPVVLPVRHMQKRKGKQFRVKRKKKNNGRGGVCRCRPSNQLSLGGGVRGLKSKEAGLEQERVGR